MVVSARPIGFRKDTIQGTPVRIKVVGPAKMFGTVGVWRGSERVDVSDPSRTIVDLLDDPSMGGGIRRLGYLLGALGLDEPGLTQRCRERMSSGVVMLDPDAPGARDSHWNLRVNARIDRMAA
jgi:predicted transcriptional regulator of viral defense system